MLTLNNYSLQVKNNWNFSVLSPTFSAKINLECENQEENTIDVSQQYSVNFQYNGKTQVSNTNTITIKKSDETIEWKEKSDISLRLKTKTITYFLKLSIVFQGG